MKFNIDRPRALITLGAGLTGLAQSNPVKATAELRLEPCQSRIVACARRDTAEGATSSSFR